MNQQTTNLVSGVAIAAAMLSQAWLITVLPENRDPSTNRLLAWTRSRRGRRVIAAIMVALALAVLVLHLVNFSAE